MNKFTQLSLFAIALLLLLKGISQTWADLSGGEGWMPTNWVVLGLQVIGLSLTVRAHISITSKGYRWEMVRQVTKYEALDENEVKEELTDPGDIYLDAGTIDAVRDKQVSGPRYKHYGS